MNSKVSVIIPVLNAADMLRRVLQALSVQSYPSELIEVIVVDNGSTDDTVEVAKSFNVNVYTYTDRKSPYAARNLGFKYATGSIIALTDANKIPDKHWLKEGVKAIRKKDTDMVGGEISFELDGNATAAQVYDSVTYNNNRFFVLEQQRSAAGNLFFKKELLKDVGNFPDMFRSGMDIWWTAKAVSSGYNISFAENSIVYCQPRKLKSLLKKSWRVGILHPVIFQQQGKGLFYILGQIFRTFAPPKPGELRKKLQVIDQSYSFFGIWGVAWFNRIMMGFGRIRGLGNLRRRIETSLEP